MTNKMTSNQAYEEAMDDVHTRFILNLPDEELQSAPRIFFQLEQAWWFYDDFICDGAVAAAAAAAAAAEEGSGGTKKKKNKKQEEPLPRFKHVKPFSLAMFKFSPLLQPMLPQFETMYGEFTTYKRSISTYGTILLNADATKMALCRVYKGKSWTLPGGKVNQNESGKDAAARETYEETGFDPESERGICASWLELRGRGEVVPELLSSSYGNNDKDDNDDDVEAPSDEENENLLPWSPLQDGDKLVYTENDTNKRRTCYVCRGIPESFPFAPVARKEISEVSWHELTSLPKHTYAVLPFMAQLRKWIKRDNRRRGIVIREKSRSGSRSKGQQQQQQQSMTPPRQIMKQQQQRQGGGGGGNNSSRGKQRPLDDDFGLTPFFSDEGNAPWEDKGGGGVAVVKEEEEEKSNAVSEKEERDQSRGKGGKTKKKKKEKQRDKSTGKKGNNNNRSNSRTNSRAGSRGRQVNANDPLVQSALATPGESNRWTEDEMFATNEQILGRKITYDGNPHDFAEKGFDVGEEGGSARVDPHAFRVVGGTFMNSSAAAGGVGVGGEFMNAPPPEASALQPLMNARRARSGSKGSNVSGLSGDVTDCGEHLVDGGDGGHDYDDDDEMILTPFFSDDGKAPWEEGGGALGGMILPGVGSDAAAAVAKKHVTPPPVRSAQSSAGQSNSKGLALLNRLRQGTSANEEGGDDDCGRPATPTAITKNEKNTKNKDKNKRDKKSNAAVGKSGKTKEGPSATNDDWFMTDKEITAKSQKEKFSILPPSPFAPSSKAPAKPVPPPAAAVASTQAHAADGYQNSSEHLIWMKRWVQQLPQAGPTKEFGDFRLDANAVLNAMAI
ncbi:hypothetical protein ACHAXR_004488 [Thalassiosira sp. AJA248-18]